MIMWLEDPHFPLLERMEALLGMQDALEYDFDVVNRA